MTLHGRGPASDQPPEPKSATSTPLRPAKIVALLLLAVAAAALVISGKGTAWMEQFLGAVERLGYWGPILFILIYATATVLMIPGSVLTLGAGAVFGVLWGSVWVSLASTLGATLAFLVARHLVRSWVNQRMAGNETFASIDRAVGEQGWKIVGLTRLSPVFPFNLLNYAFGITKVPFLHYVLASWIGMMPGTILFVYLGSLARAGVRSREKTVGEWVFYGVGLLATFVVTVWITRYARRALRERTGAGKPSSSTEPHKSA